MSEIITIYELYEKDGGGMGVNVGAIGYFQSLVEAEKAGHALGHGYYGIHRQAAIQLEDGSMYLLVQTQPISFGLKRR